jgi:Rieske Fe-S protein
MDEATCTGGCACGTTASGTSAPARREQAPVTRRGVLAGSAAVVATLALGACASSEQTSSGAPATTPDESPAGAESSPSPDAGVGEVLATTSEFPTGGGKVVTTTAAGVVVVTQPADGEFKAFSGKCTHQGCPVSEVLENEIRCNCHGSTFDATTGDPMAGPAMVGLAPVAIAVEGTDIVLA